MQHISLPYVYPGQRVQGAINCLTHRSVDGFNINAGLAKFRQLEGIISAANLFCWHGSKVDLGILETMYLHQSAAASACIWPSDIFGRLHKKFDGHMPLAAGGRDRLNWRTVYFCERVSGQWLIASFIGYLKHKDD